MPKEKYEGEGIPHPHEHDVLSGRGNFVNYHPGNEHFRGLVRKYKVDYVKCPKPQKGKFSRVIYDEVRARDPPGRFLKQDPATKLWHDIGEKKALDKTRQALREGAPEIMKELSGESGDDDSDDEGGDGVIARKKVRQRVWPTIRVFLNYRVEFFKLFFSHSNFVFSFFLSTLETTNEKEYCYY
jgi:hypothetical protein